MLQSASEILNTLMRKIIRLSLVELVYALAHTRIVIFFRVHLSLHTRFARANREFNLLSAARSCYKRKQTSYRRN